MQTVIRGAPVTFVTSVTLLAYPGPTRGLGAFLLLVSLIIILASPYLVRVIYFCSGKLWGIQGWFFGSEGYLDLATIESQIFGAYMGRLK